MGVPMITCALCGKSVTKRSTLSLEVLGAKNGGRACRSHDEVAQLVEALQKMQEEGWLLKKAERQIQLLATAAAVRVLHSMFGESLETIYLRFEMIHGKAFVDDVRADVDRLGGPVMSYCDILSSVFVASDIARRQEEN